MTSGSDWAVMALGAVGATGALVAVAAAASRRRRRRAIELARHAARNRSELNERRIEVVAIDEAAKSTRDQKAHP